jgi:hypothetical protein
MFTSTSEQLKKFVIRHVIGWDAQCFEILASWDGSDWREVIWKRRRSRILFDIIVTFIAIEFITMLFIGCN